MMAFAALLQRLSTRKNHPAFSPLCQPVPTISPSHHGYTVRRDSEAGSARGLGRRRRTPCIGPAENGLPPATWGKRRGVGPILPLHAPDGAPDVPVRHTRRPGLADASASSAGMETRRKAKNLPPGSPRRAVPVSNGDALPGNRRAHPRSRPLQRDPSRGQKPLNGAPDGVILQISDAAPPAPCPMFFDKPRAKRRVGETVGTVQPSS